MRPFLLFILLLPACGPLLLITSASSESQAGDETAALLVLLAPGLASQSGVSGNATDTGGGTEAGSHSSPVVSDALTGLVWQRCSAGQGATDCAGTAATLDHAAALAYCSGLNLQNGGLGFADRNDWRLPAVQELTTLVDPTRSYPAIDATSYPGTFTVLSYWTADVYPSATGYAYGVAFNYGVVGPQVRNGGLYVRCVAGTFVTAPTSFAHAGDGTVNDSSASLSWTRCTLGPGDMPADGSGYDCSGPISFYDQAAAGAACDGLVYAGHSDWRLPRLNELQRPVNYAAFQPAAHAGPFPNTAHSVYWTATDFASSLGSGWTVDFTYGLASAASATGIGRVRCVR